MFHSVGSILIAAQILIIFSCASSLEGDDFHFVKPRESRLRVFEREALLLECSVSDERWVEYSWTVDGKAVKGSNRRYEVGRNLHFSYTLHGVDDGNFSCVAKNQTSGFTLESNPIALNIIWLNPAAIVQLSVPDDSSSIRRGGIFILKCQAEGSEEILYEWFKNGILITKSQRVSFYKEKLQVNNITSEDIGSYSCRAKNDVGVAESNSFFQLTLPGEKSLKIINIPTDRIVENGGMASFDCRFRSGEIEWFFDDSATPLSNNSKYVVYGNGTLVVRRVEESDQGTYKCVGSWEEETQTFLVTLNSPFLKTLKRESLLPTPIPQVHKLGMPDKSDIEIFCVRPEGFPLPKVWWEGSGGKNIPTSGGDVTQDSSTLRITNFRSELSGNYSCLAGNGFALTKTFVNLIPTTAPTIFGHPLGTIAEEGERVSFTCLFRGPPHPISEMKWLKGRQPLQVPKTSPDGRPPRVDFYPQNGSVVIHVVQLTDAGDYTCEIMTPGFPPVRSQPAQLFVTETLKFRPKPIDRKLELGSASRIPCKAQGAPPPVVKWVKVKDGLAFFNWPPHIQDLDGTLYFQKVENSDKGEYSCVATNQKGIINTTIHVDVIVTPKFLVTPKNLTEAMEGETLMIHCKAIGDPNPTIQWDKNLNMNGFDHKRFQVLENGTLLIKGVTRDDTGQYGCTAGNSVGLIRSEVKLLVKTNEHFIFESPDDGSVMTRTVSITLSVAAGYMFLVIGLMLWCRFRQLRRKQEYLAEIRHENGDAEMKDANPISNGNGPLLVPVANGHSKKRESGRESVKSDGEAAKSLHSSNGKIASATASVASHKSGLSSQSKKSMYSAYDKISLPRNGLQFVMLLGHGEFGEVFLAKTKKVNGDNGEESLLMVKALQTREESALFEYKREIDMYYKLSHENVSRLVRLCREMDPHYMIMDYSDWGDLKQFLLATRKDSQRNVPKPPPLTIAQIIQVVTQVTLGMENLSNHRFVHKDLATRNCLISSGLRIQVSNPCLSKDTYSNEYYKYKNRVVPIRWLPYEAAIEDDFSTKSDVWAWAVLVWEVISQAGIPFHSTSNENVAESLEKKENKWENVSFDQNVPKNLQALLSQCWDPCPTNRPSFSTIAIQLADII